MKNLLSVFLGIAVLFSPNILLATKPTDGYFNLPVAVDGGVLVTNELHSSIYLIENNKMQQLIAAPGAGRFIELSRNGKVIGFKLINETTGRQAPAIIDATSRGVRLLDDEANNVGQVSFANDGTVAYMIEKTLILNNNGKRNKHYIGVFSNRTPISPDGTEVVFKDHKDQLWLYNIRLKKAKRFTDGKKGYAGANFSPNGKYISYTTVGSEIYVYDRKNRKNFFIGEGEGPSWSKDSQEIVYFIRDIDFSTISLVNSDLYISSFDGSSKRRVTFTDNVFEMQPSFEKAGTVLYHTYASKEIKRLNPNVKNSSTTVFKLDKPLELRNFFNEMNQHETRSRAGLPDWTHIHQVYDTPDWFVQGRVSCGATSAIQALASYGVLGKWENDCSYPYQHVSQYGLYVAEKYTFDEVTFSGYSGRYAKGAHGYMWQKGSPFKVFSSFLKKHGINSQTTQNVSWMTVINELNQNFPYIICSTGLTGGHIVMIVGQYKGYKSLYVNDPYGNKNAGDYGYKLNGKNSIYDWADENTGHIKITPIAYGVSAQHPSGVKFEKLWSLNDFNNNIPTWFSSKHNTERGIAYANSHLYVASRSKGDRVMILDAATGETIGELQDPETISGGTYNINDVEASDDGHILVSNLTVDAKRYPFKIYKWKDESSKAEVFITLQTETKLRLGDAFSVTGDISKKAVVFAVASDSNIVYRWDVIEGVVSKPIVIKLKGIANVGINPSAQPLGLGEKDDFYVNGGLIRPTLFGFDGENKAAVSSDIITKSSGAMSLFSVEDDLFLSTFQSVDQNAKIVKVTDGPNNVTTSSLYGVTEILGNNKNSNRTGDIIVVSHKDPKSVTVYVLSTNNGLGAYKLRYFSR
jgi:hypothetical protein